MHLFVVQRILGGSMVRLKTMSRTPRMRWTTKRCICQPSSEEGDADLEELFHLTDLTFVHQKQNHMVATLDLGIVMGD